MTRFDPVIAFLFFPLPSSQRKNTHPSLPTHHFSPLFVFFTYILTLSLPLSFVPPQTDEISQTSHSKQEAESVQNSQTDQANLLANKQE